MIGTTILVTAVKTVRILTAMVSCCLLAMPVSGFPTLKQFLFEQGVYEDLCRVEPWSASSIKQIHCVSRAMAFDGLFALGSLSIGLATLIAYFALDYIGFAFSSISGNFLIAAGAYVLSGPPESLVFTYLDRYFWGYALICAGAPFVVVGALDSASLVRRQPLVLIVVLLALSQLSSGIWSYWIDYFEPKDVIELFARFLLVPSWLILANTIVIPFSSQSPPGNVARLLERACGSSVADLAPDAWLSPAEVPLLSTTAPVSYDGTEETSLWELTRNRSSSKFSGLWFWPYALFFVVNMLGLNVFVAGGAEHAWGQKGAFELITETFISKAPVVTALFVPIAVVLIRRFSLLSLLIVASVSSVLCQLLPTFALWQPPFIHHHVQWQLPIWEATTVLVALTRTFLAGLTFDYCNRVFGFAGFGVSVGLIFTISGAADMLVPTVDYLLLTSYRGTNSIGHLFALTQAIVSLMTFFIIRHQSWRADRRILDIEAESVQPEPLPHTSQR